MIKPLKIKFYSFLFVCFFAQFICAQTVDIVGKVIAPEDIVGIHIINKTESKYTITDDNGNFIIPAKLNDTLIISAIKYQPENVLITSTIINTKSLTVFLKENINQLDEVVVGKVLTGNLMSDIENSSAKRDINFYDLGIPGYTGRQKTQSERRLFEAQTGSGLIPLNPILNWISGRTKQLKNQIKLERQDQQMNRTISEFSDMLVELESLEESRRMEFFYFSSEDPEFMAITKTRDDIKMLEFLQKKLIEFKANLNQVQD